MAQQQEIAIYSGGGFSVPTTSVLKIPLPNGTMSAVRVKMPSNCTGDAIWNFSIDGVAQFTNELTVPSGSSEKDATGLAIVTTDDNLGVFSIEAPFPSVMPDPPYRFYITYDDGTVIDVAGAIHAATSKATPVDADELGLADSAASFALKKLTWANLKATIKSYYDAVAATLTNKDLTSGTNTFPTFNQNTTGSAATLTTSRNIDGQAFNGSADVTVIAPGTHAATSKTTPVDADELPIVDSAASNVLKKLTWANLKATLKTYFDTLYQAVLVSGTNIKTINSTSLLGSGDIAISGSVATDAIFDAKGDLAVGTGADTAAKLTVGTNGQFLKADSAQATGLIWDSIPGGGDLLSTNNLSDVANAATARTNLGLAIGTDVQAHDADLDTWATKTPPSGTPVGTSDAQTLTNKSIAETQITFTDVTTGNASILNHGFLKKLDNNSAHFLDGTGNWSTPVGGGGGGGAGLGLINAISQGNFLP